MRFLATVSLILLALSVPVAAAGVEVTLATGWRGGEAGFPIEATGPLVVCVTTPCILAEASAGEEMPLSLIVDVPLAGPWMLEGLVTRVDGDLDLRSSFSSDSLDRESYESTTVQVGVLRHFGEGRLRPFAAAAVGATGFESTAQAYDRPLFPGISARPVDEEAASASVAGGFRAGLGRRLALRVEARVYWHDLPDLLGGSLWQQEAGVGLTYRW